MGESLDTFAVVHVATQCCGPSLPAAKTDNHPTARAKLKSARSGCITTVLSTISFLSNLQIRIALRTSTCLPEGNASAGLYTLRLYSQYLPTRHSMSDLAMLCVSCCKIETVTKLSTRRGGRAVEYTGLENRHTLTGIGGSNPSLSAIWSNIGSD